MLLVYQKHCKSCEKKQRFSDFVFQWFSCFDLVIVGIRAKIAEKGGLRLMSIKEKIMQDLTAAMKAKDTSRVSTLRMMKTAITNKQIEKESVNTELTEDEIIKTLQSLVKQRKDSIEQYRKAGRNDLAEKEEAEIKIIEEYLPRPASTQEIIKAVEEAISETGATSIKDLGVVMKTAITKLSGKSFDGKQVNQIAREKLK